MGKGKIRGGKGKDKGLKKGKIRDGKRKDKGWERER